jgi:hypothetical protein
MEAVATRRARLLFGLASAVIALIAFPGTAKAVSVDKACPATVVPGGQMQCTFSVTANGVFDIALGGLTDTVPLNTTFLGVSVSGGLGSVCPGLGSPGVGGTGTLNCTVSVNGTGGPNTQTFTITFMVNPTATGTISNTACYNPAIGTSLCDTATSDVAATAVTMRTVSATQKSGGVLVRWRTASELDTLGYNVYRSVHGKRVRLNRSVIRAKGHGAAYSFLDRTASNRPARYFVQAVSLDGSRAWYGPAKVLRR